MAFRSQRYHLSQGRTKRKKKKFRQTARRWMERAAGGKKERNEECTGVCIVVELAVVLYFIHENSAADIAHPEYFMGRVWNEIKLATRRSRQLPSGA